MYKKLELTVLAIAATVLLACQPEEKESARPSQSDAEMDMTISASPLLGSWNVGDSLSILDNSGSHVFRTQASGASAVFSGKSYVRSRSRIALFPCADGAEYSTESLSVSGVVPAEQYGFAPAAAAISSGTAFSMRDLSAAVKFSIASDDIEYIEVTSAGGEPISGDAVLTFSSSGQMQVSFENTGTSICLRPAAGAETFAAGEHLFSCLPGSFPNGLHFSVVHAGDWPVEHTSTALQLKTGKIGDAGVIEDGTAPAPTAEDIALIFIANDASPSLEWPFATPAVGEISSSLNPTDGSFVGKEQAFTLPESKGGYVFKICSRLNGVAKNSSQGIRMGGQTGDYIELPMLRGRYLTSIRLDCGYAGTSLQVQKADGTPVRGGGVTSSFGNVGESFTWNLYESERSTAYRLVTYNTNAAGIRRLYLHYSLEPLQAPEGSISPKDFGYLEATDGIGRFQAIRRAHITATALGLQVDYSGLSPVNIEIPANAPSIPIGNNTDFGGAVFNVKNVNKDGYNLFVLYPGRTPIVLTGSQIDSKDYSKVPELKSGLHLLIVEDATAWVAQREGHDYSADRSDAILVRDGVAQNGTVMPYNTPATVPVCSYIEVDDSQKTFCNITFNRVAGSTARTFLVRIDAQNNIKISNVTVNTPDPAGLVGDAAIRIFNSTNLLMEDVTINGSYSKSDTYGYGISLNAIWHGTFRRITSNTAWGVFGCNNTHDSVIEDSNIDRYDTHCYGRNITMRRCNITNRGLPVASIYGTILLEDNVYNNCYPYSVRQDYNSYVPLDIIIRNCEITTPQSLIFQMGRLDNIINARPELEEKCWHNVTIDGLKMVVPDWQTDMYLFYPQKTGTNNTYGQPLGHLSKIDIKNLEFVYPSGKTASVRFNLSGPAVTLKNNLACKFEDLKLSAPGDTAPVQIIANIKGPENSYEVKNSNVTIVE